MQIEEAFDRLNFIKKRWFKKILFIFLILVIILPLIFSFSLFFVIQPPKDFPLNQIFEIKKGMNVTEIANFLEDKKIIQSATAFKAYDYYQKYKNKTDSKIKSGHYLFETKLDIFEVYSKLERGDSGIKGKKIKILEGWANFQIADELSKTFDKISKEKFLEEAKDYEGYLYPDTYIFSPYEINEKIVVKKMHKNFEKKTKDIKIEVDKSKYSWEKIIIMASLIEDEAGSAPYSVKRKVSGVLWHRINIGMPLQVDAVFDYIYKKHIGRKLFSHLKVDSPYNTYKYQGLPPTAIGNPSRESIQAALWPERTNNKFYLTGKDGKFYFSKTLAQHNQYKNKYISNYVPQKADN